MTLPPGQVYSIQPVREEGIRRVVSVEKSKLYHVLRAWQERCPDVPCRRRYFLDPDGLVKHGYSLTIHTVAYLDRIHCATDMSSISCSVLCEAE